MSVIDYIAFAFFALHALYLLAFAALSLRKMPTPAAAGKGARRMAVLIPAYKEDNVIMDCVRSVLEQRYPHDRFVVVVISDRMSEETNRRLSRLPLRLINVEFENSTKARSLNTAMDRIGDAYDVAVVLDADNVVASTFLSEINAAFDAGWQAVQAHRTAKNMNTDVAVLDALSEEVNNSIFRKGHCAAGLSSALIGSGMAFDYALYKTLLRDIHSVAEDRALEFALFRRRVRIVYLPDTPVWDEKIQSAAHFSNQRRRWLSAQYQYVKLHMRDFFPQLLAGNWDYCDKIVQHVMLPRLMSLGLTLVIAAGVSVFHAPASAKWWALFAAIVLALTLATPRKLYTRRLLNAFLRLPQMFVLQFANLFRLKDAHRSFIHTPHGINHPNAKEQ